MTPDSQLSYLDRVVMEMVETERTYVCDLRMIIEDYLSHIIDQSRVSLSPDQVVSLFGNIEDIYAFNSELLQCLDLCDNDPVAVARCFVTKKDDFGIYTQFCNNYPNSVAALTDCMRNKSLAKFFRDRQAALQTPLPLGSYLLKPVQRILKYHLLLQEMAKNFNQDDEGFEVMEEAIGTMTSVARYINDMKRKHEHAVRLQEVQSLLVNWKGPDLTTYGELVLEGTFKLHGAKNQRTLFLFQRLLLITRRRVDHFVYKTHISCSTLMLIDTKDSRSFSVTHYKRPKKPHTVQARTVEERELWAHHIKRVILENHHALMPQKLWSPGEAGTDHGRCLLQDKDVTQAPLRHGQRRPGPVEEHEEQQSGDGHSRWFAQSRRDDSVVLVCSAPVDDITELSEVEQEAAQPRTHPEGTKPALPQRGLVLPFERTTGSEPGSEPPRSPEPEEAEEPVLAAGDSRALSSGDSSDEERDKDRPGILPPSVLNQAGDIANHVSSIRRHGGVRADWHRVTSRPGTLYPQGSDASQRPQPDGAASRRLSDCDRSRRRDSVLTRHDRLLIGKIKSYYESAATRNSSLSLQRRESLNHIPSGLVRSSVSRFNNVPGLPGCSKGPALLGHTESGRSLDSLASDPSHSVDEGNSPSPETVWTWKTTGLQSALTSLKHQRLQEAARTRVPASDPSEPTLNLDQKLDDVAESKTHVRPECSEAADDRAESKVLHLARCYSQRLRESKPAARGPETGPRPLPNLTEESPDKPVQTQNLNIDPPPPVAPAPPRLPHPSGFYWPDVRELCSKYSDHGAVLDQRGPGCSAGSFRPERGPDPDPGAERRTVSEPPPTVPTLRELEPLPEMHRPSEAAEDLEKVLASDNSEEQTYVQIRSPTSREKISILAVIDRCRAYQESDEFRHRETAPPDVHEDKVFRAKTPADQNLVKNLREKFQ